MTSYENKKQNFVTKSPRVGKASATVSGQLVQCILTYPNPIGSLAQRISEMFE